MLLFSFNRMCRITAIYLTSILCAVLFAFTSLGAGIIDKNEKKDLILRSNKGDLMTIHGKVKTSSISRDKEVVDKIDKSNHDKSNSQFLTVTRDKEDISKPDRNYIDVYIGKCPFTVDAVREIKRFLLKHNNYHVKFFGIKTISDYQINPSAIAGIEIFLPIDAGKYDIKGVPAFIINVNGNLYKVSGAVDLEDIYNEIIKGKAEGERKEGYIDLGTKGKECKAASVNLKLRPLKESDKKDIEKKVQFKVSNVLKQDRITLPQKDSPEVINKKMAHGNLTGIGRFIVFSESQKDWAKEMTGRGAVGCCTDCSNLEGMGSYIQFCTKELLNELGVRSVPSVVNIN
ncbi:MAG: hypothetical protein IBX72_15010 [Nitrospirae bacterium]|nr:hypothetical protein [Nitrospirota bacterium]